MPVPWVQIVRLMPSILEVSRELLKRARRSSGNDLPSPAEDSAGAPSGVAALEARIAQLEENERRQAELVTSMADQLSQLTTAVTALHRQVRGLIIAETLTAVIAVVALVFAMR